jgi:hypothetical protein
MIRIFGEQTNVLHLLGIEPRGVQTSLRLNSWPRRYHQIQNLFLKVSISINCETVDISGRAAFLLWGAVMRVTVKG